MVKLTKFEKNLRTIDFVLKKLLVAACAEEIRQTCISINKNPRFRSGGHSIFIVNDYFCRKNSSYRFFPFANTVNRIQIDNFLGFRLIVLGHTKHATFRFETLMDLIMIRPFSSKGGIKMQYYICSVWSFSYQFNTNKTDILIH